MKLQANNRQLAMGNRHHFAGGGPGGDVDFRRQRFALDDERVVSAGCKRILKTRKYSLAMMFDRTGPPVHRLRRSDDICPVRGGNDLMPQADTEHRRRLPELPYNFDRASRLPRGARAGRKHNRSGPKSTYVFNIENVVPANPRFMPQPTEISRQIVYETVVDVDKQYHSTV